MSVHESARRGFERQADAYERGRPSYPPEAVAWLADQVGLQAGRTVVDVGESLPLGSGTADAIVVGQAFHWFDGPAALAEFHRVLAPGGHLGLIWNLRDRRQPLQQAINEITEPLRGTTPSVGRGDWRRVFEYTSLFEPRGEHRVAFEVAIDRQTFVDRIGSISFIAGLEDPQRRQVLDRVRRVADEHPEPWRYETEIYVYARSGTGSTPELRSAG